jgi:hypothetical protein
MKSSQRWGEVTCKIASFIAAWLRDFNCIVACFGFFTSGPRLLRRLCRDDLQPRVEPRITSRSITRSLTCVATSYRRRLGVAAQMRAREARTQQVRNARLGQLEINHGSHNAPTPRCSPGSTVSADALARSARIEMSFCWPVRPPAPDLRQPDFMRYAVSREGGSRTRGARQLSGRARRVAARPQRSRCGPPG